MNFIPAELIRKKRRGESHSEDEINFLIDAYTRGTIPDYQMAAWAMAVCFQGLKSSETAWLTAAMCNSGDRLNFSHLNAPRVDKHSTGGVGDKTSLLIGPILAACEIYTPMIAGRGLGHTGGTLDKLESIPGFRIQLTEAEYTQHVEKHFFSIMGQTERICPADKKLYALRDVTGTVDSLPLICGSIMSKKLAEDLTGLVLDVKFGSGAFMKSIEDCEALARLLKTTGEQNGVDVHACLTNMDQPLGRFAGNAVEVQECVDIFQNKTCVHDGHDFYADTRELSLILAAHGILLSKKAANFDEAYALASHKLESGEAWRQFEKLLQYQGPARIDQLPKAKFETIFESPQSGILESINTELLGLATVELGVGRKKSSDPVDPAAGIEILARPLDRVRKSQPLFKIMTSNEKLLEPALELVRRSICVVDHTNQKTIPLVAKVLI